MAGRRTRESSEPQTSHDFCYEIPVDHFKLAALGDPQRKVRSRAGSFNIKEWERNNFPKSSLAGTRERPVLFEQHRRTLVGQIAIDLSGSSRNPTDGRAIPRMKNEKRCFIRGIALPSAGFLFQRSLFERHR
jgi:hypothetical protein